MKIKINLTLAILILVSFQGCKKPSSNDDGDASTPLNQSQSDEFSRPVPLTMDPDTKRWWISKAGPRTNKTQNQHPTDILSSALPGKITFYPTRPQSPYTILTPRNRTLAWATLALVVLMSLIFYCPPIARTLHFRPPHLSDLLTALGIGGVCGILFMMSSRRYAWISH